MRTVDFHLLEAPTIKGGAEDAMKVMKGGGRSEVDPHFT